MQLSWQARFSLQPVRRTFSFQAARLDFRSTTRLTVVLGLTTATAGSVSACAKVAALRTSIRGRVVNLVFSTISSVVAFGTTGLRTTLLRVTTSVFAVERLRLDFFRAILVSSPLCLLRVTPLSSEMPIA
jgi:hypothetical protein